MIPAEWRQVCDLRHPNPPNQHHLVHDSTIRAIVVQHRPHGSWQLITGGEDGAVIASDPTTWELSCHRFDVPVLAVAAPGEGIAVGLADGTLLLLDPEVSEERWRVPDAHPGGITVLHVTGDTLVSGGTNGRIRSWRIADGSPTGELPGHDGIVSGILTLDDARLATVGGDGRLRLWDLDSATQVDSIDPGGGFLTSVLIRGERLAVSCHDGTVRFLDQTGVTVVSSPDGFPLWAALPTASGEELAVAGDVHGFRLIDPGTGRVRCRPVRTPHDCSAMAIMPDGRFVVGDADGMLWLWDPARLPVTQPSFQPVFAVAPVSLDGRALLLTGDMTGVIQVWDPATGEPVGEALDAHTDAVRALVTLAAPDGRQLLASAGDDRTIIVWDLSTRQVLNVLRGHEDWISCLVPVGVEGQVRLLSGAEDHTLRLWDPLGGQLGEPWSGHTDWVLSTATWTEPDGTVRIASAGFEDAVLLWDAAGGLLGELFPGSKERGAFHDGLLPLDGGHLATLGNDAALHIWDPHLGEDLARIPMPDEAMPLDIVALGSSGEILVTVDEDGWLRAWRQEGQLLAERHIGATLCLAALDRDLVAVGFRTGWATYRLVTDG